MLTTEVRENEVAQRDRVCAGVTDHGLQGSSTPRRAREGGDGEERKIKGVRPKVSSHLKVCTCTASITHTDAQNTPNHKVAQRQKQRIPQLGIHPRPRRAGLSQCR